MCHLKESVNFYALLFEWFIKIKIDKMSFLGDLREEHKRKRSRPYRLKRANSMHIGLHYRQPLTGWMNSKERQYLKTIENEKDKKHWDYR